MAAAVADFRPATRGRRTRSRRAAGTAWSCRSSPPPTCSAALSARAAPGPDAGRLRRRARRGRGWSARADKLERKGLDAVVLNDISRPDIGFDSERQRGHDRHRRAARPGRRRRRRRASWRLRSSTGWRAEDSHRGRGAMTEDPRSAEERGEVVYDLFRAGQRAAGGRRLRRRHHPARAGPARSSPTRPRSARRSAAPTSARAASSRPARSSPRWSSAPRSTTTPTSAWAGRSCKTGRPRRRAATPCWPRACARTARTTGRSGTGCAPPAELDGRHAVGRLELAHRHRALHHQAEQAVELALVQRARPAGRRAPTPRATRVQRSGPGASSGSTTGASTGRSRPGRSARAPATVSRPSASRRPTSSGQPAAWSAPTVTPHSPWASRRVSPGSACEVGVDDVDRGHRGEGTVQRRAGDRPAGGRGGGARGRRAGGGDRPGPARAARRAPRRRARAGRPDGRASCWRCGSSRTATGG